jgi:phosphoribosylanthranilate isomerase
LNGWRTRVKMCGMTRKEDIDHAINLGVDAVGLIFYPQSRRCVSVSQAQSLLKNTPPFVDVVAVLVNPEIDLVQRIINELPIQLLQFHGKESADFCAQFARPYIKTIHPVNQSNIEEAMHVYEGAAAILLDTPSEELQGGTGRCFDWQMIPQQRSKPLILAGGLNEQNVLLALKQTQAFAIDVCSALEVTAGIKDHQKMQQFMQVLRNAHE